MGNLRSFIIYLKIQSLHYRIVSSVLMLFKVITSILYNGFMIPRMSYVCCLYSLFGKHGYPIQHVMFFKSREPLWLKIDLMVTAKYFCTNSSGSSNIGSSNIRSS